MTEKNAKKYIDFIIKYDKKIFNENIIYHKFINIDSRCVEFEIITFEDESSSESTFYRLPIIDLLNIYNDILIDQRKEKLKNINKLRKKNRTN